jgi:outer membrane receptor protein involved in Fe transport
LTVNADELHTAKCGFNTTLGRYPNNPFQDQGVTVMKLATAVRLVLATAALSTALPASSQETTTVLEEIIVTAQKREESIQDVPIAVSAFSNDDLVSQRIDGGYNLQVAVPNLVFAGGTGANPNFYIRGVGAAVAGTTGDSGVLPHHNNVPLVSSRMGGAEFYDLERLEVLRGPQGTLYGRNASGGVINQITAKPKLDSFDGSVSIEGGSYGTIRSKAHVNIPLGEMFAARVAAAYLQRDGYTENTATGNDIDSRDLMSARATLLFQPLDSLKVTLLYEYFEEDDSRSGGAKTLCIKDPGPTSVGGISVNVPAAQNYLSRGCQQGSIYQPSAFGTVNSVATFGGVFSNIALLTSGDTFINDVADPDLRKVSFYRDPTFEATNDIATLDVQWDFLDGLKLSVLGSYTTDETYTTGGSQQSSIGFNVTAITPGGVYTDPQGGPGNGTRTLTYVSTDDKQASVELRLQSSFDGALNFNAGLFYLDLERSSVTFTSTNATNAFRQTTASQLGYIDLTPGIPVSGLGHNYFYSFTPYDLDSRAAFGELYWDATDTVKLTVGARYTEDTKNRINYPILLFAPQGAGSGVGSIGQPGWPTEAPPIPPLPATTQDLRPRAQEIEFSETTGRVVLDWKPTDNVLVYGSVSRGYKAGGFNSPAISGPELPYDSEVVDAFEVGSKNSLFDGRVKLNATAFYYDYQGYQYGKIEGFQVNNKNLDAEVMGLELEALWAPVDALVLDAKLGVLQTEIKSGASIDPFDRTQGNPNLTYLKAISGGCVADTALLSGLINTINGNPAFAAALSGVGAGALCGTTPSFNVGQFPGVEDDLSGNELPYSPEMTIALGAQYTLNIGASWTAMIRGDYYRQDEAFVSHFNSENYKVNAWDNYNASLTFGNADLGLDIQLYGKNLADEDVIVGYAVQSEQLGLTRAISLLDPALYGVSVTYRFGN